MLQQNWRINEERKRQAFTNLGIQLRGKANRIPRVKQRTFHAGNWATDRGVEVLRQDTMQKNIIQ